MPTAGALEPRTASSSSRAERRGSCCASTATSGRAEVPEIRAFFDRFGDRLPAELAERLATLEQDLARVAV